MRRTLSLVTSLFFLASGALGAFAACSQGTDPTGDTGHPDATSGDDESGDDASSGGDDAATSGDSSEPGDAGDLDAAGDATSADGGDASDGASPYGPQDVTIRILGSAQFSSQKLCVHSNDFPTRPVFEMFTDGFSLGELSTTSPIEHGSFEADLVDKEDACPAGASLTSDLILESGKSYIFAAHHALEDKAAQPQRFVMAASFVGGAVDVGTNNGFFVAQFSQATDGLVKLYSSSAAGITGSTEIVRKTVGQTTVKSLSLDVGLQGKANYVMAFFGDGVTPYTFVVCDPANVTGTHANCQKTN